MASKPTRLYRVEILHGTRWHPWSGLEYDRADLAGSVARAQKQCPQHRIEITEYDLVFVKRPRKVYGAAE